MGKKRVHVDVAKALGVKLGVKWNRVDFTPYDLAAGMSVEMEHQGGKTDVVGKDVNLDTAKIALAHLKEGGDYYKRLAKMEKDMKKSDPLCRFCGDTATKSLTMNNGTTVNACGACARKRKRKGQVKENCDLKRSEGDLTQIDPMADIHSFVDMVKAKKGKKTKMKKRVKVTRGGKTFYQMREVNVEGEEIQEAKGKALGPVADFTQMPKSHADLVNKLTAYLKTNESKLTLGSHHDLPVGPKGGSMGYFYVRTGRFSGGKPVYVLKTRATAMLDFEDVSYSLEGLAKDIADLVFDELDILTPEQEKEAAYKKAVKNIENKFGGAIEALEPGDKVQHKESGYTVTRGWYGKGGFNQKGQGPTAYQISRKGDRSSTSVYSAKDASEHLASRLYQIDHDKQRHEEATRRAPPGGFKRGMRVQNAKGETGVVQSGLTPPGKGHVTGRIRVKTHGGKYNADQIWDVIDDGVSAIGAELAPKKELTTEQEVEAFVKKVHEKLGTPKVPSKGLPAKRAVAGKAGGKKKTKGDPLKTKEAAEAYFSGSTRSGPKESYPYYQKKSQKKSKAEAKPAKAPKPKKAPKPQKAPKAKAAPKSKAQKKTTTPSDITSLPVHAVSVGDTVSFTRFGTEISGKITKVSRKGSQAVLTIGGQDFPMMGHRKVKIMKSDDPTPIIGDKPDLVDFLKAHASASTRGWARKMKREGGEHPFTWCSNKVRGIGFTDDPNAFCAAVHLAAYGMTPMQRKKAKESKDES